MCAAQSPQMSVPSIEESQTKRTVQNWTLTTDFYLAAVQEAKTHNALPDIFNTDRGCQFTSQEFMGLLTQRHIAIIMDTLGCSRDHVFVERLWGVSHMKRCISLLSKTGSYRCNFISNPLIRKEMGRG